MSKDSQFLNPYVIFESFINPDRPFEQQLTLVQKKLLTEIGLSETHSIRIEEFEFTKDSILKLFESYKSFSHWNFYVVLIADVDLSGFLEQNFHADKINFLENEIYTTPEFIEFISPAFRSAFINFVIWNFNIPDDIKLRYIFTQTGFMTADDLLLAYTEIHEALLEMVKRMNEFENRFKKDAIAKINETEESEIRGTTSTDFIEAVNSLPPDFSLFIIEYSVAAINLGVALPSHQLQLKKFVMKNLTLLHTEPEYTKLIKSNHKAMRGRVFDSVEDDTVLWTIVRVVAIAGFLLLKMSRC